MHLTWYGHASFRIEASDGTTIVTDPYHPDTSGYKKYPDPADLVVISSSTDSFHCNADLIPGSPTVVDALTIAQNGGARTELGIRIQAIETMEALIRLIKHTQQQRMLTILRRILPSK